MSKFTDRLWRDIVREHGPELAQMEPPAAAAHRRRARPRVLAGTGVGVACVATAAVLILGAASSSPAFAVTRNRDGSFSVRVETWTAIPAANRALHGLGLHAQLVAVSAACDKVLSNSSSDHTRTLTLQAFTQSTPALITAKVLARQARIDPRGIPRGKTLIIPTWRVDKQVRVMPETVVSAAPACMAPPCALGQVAAPALSNSGNSGNSGASSGNSGASSGNSGGAAAGASSGSGNSGAASDTSTTHLHLQPPASWRVQVPVTVRNQLVHLAKLAAKWCPKAAGSAPPPSGANSGNSGNSGNS